jgi:aconitate hydratase
MASMDAFGSQSRLHTAAGEFTFFRLQSLADRGIAPIDRLPYSMRILLEACLRRLDRFVVTEEHVADLAAWNAAAPKQVEVPFLPARVVLQDFTGVPAVVDLAALRSAMVRMGGDPKRINPLVPCDLVIDHSVQVDYFGTADSLERNVALEFERNSERYQFLRWGQKAFNNFRVVPPATGIVHQVNLEYLAKVVMHRDGVAFPDSLVGTDSHTTMINGLGVAGWGVGGIEAEAVMLGQPISMLLPEVVGFELVGQLPEGATATDLVLTATQMLRKHGVVNKFVEFFGSGVSTMSLPDRATLANMAPEYGATMGYFPVDQETLRYLERTGRTRAEIDLVERYTKEQGLFRTEGSPVPAFSSHLRLDLGSVTPSLAGPRRPQDRVPLAQMRAQWRTELAGPFGKKEPAAAVDVALNGATSQISDGSVVIAAITSCTNTSNPSVLIAAGLLARNAVNRGLARKPWVKTSLAPGSRVVTDYLRRSGLDRYLDRLGFQTVGYGCTTCIGNSGPLPEAVAVAVKQANLVVSAVLSGNRNFEGRINPHVKANWLASPPLVVAYALAGTVDIDLVDEPLGRDDRGHDVYLREIWPSREEISKAIEGCMSPETFIAEYERAALGPPQWQAIPATSGDLYPWDANSTYVQEPPFFVDMPAEPPPLRAIRGARVLVSVADSVTTDHISPAGSIKADSPAGLYLQSRGVGVLDFNSYGARRGNDRVMTRGTFANIRLRNLLAPGTEGGVTRLLPGGQTMSIYDASLKYKEAGTPLLVLAGAEYGTGSSRDWAAKGTFLLGIRAVIAVSYERIHRSNLVGMGVLPLEFQRGQSREALNLDGTEIYDIKIDSALKPLSRVPVEARRADGSLVSFEAVCRIDTPIEAEYYRHGGILHYVLRQMAK